jgi:hypothetical protein
MKIGLPAVVQYVLQGGYNKKSTGSFRSPGLFHLAAWASELATHPNKKIPHFVKDFFLLCPGLDGVRFAHTSL